MLTSRHLGRFEIDFGTINENPGVVQGIMGNVIVVDATIFVDKGVISYLAISEDNFEAVPDGEFAPSYELSVNSDDGGETFQVDFQKQG